MADPRQWQTTYTRHHSSRPITASAPGQFSDLPNDDSYAFMRAEFGMNSGEPQGSGVPQGYFASHFQYPDLQMPTTFSNTNTQSSNFSHPSYAPTSSAPSYVEAHPAPSNTGPATYLQDQNSAYSYAEWLPHAPISVHSGPSHIDTGARYQTVESAPFSAPAALSSFLLDTEGAPAGQISLDDTVDGGSPLSEDGLAHNPELSPVPEGSYRCECGAILSTTNKSRNQATHRRSKKHRKAMGEPKHKAENLLCRWCSRSYARSDSCQRHERSCFKRPGSRGKRRKPYCRRSRSPSLERHANSMGATPFQGGVGSSSAFNPPLDSRSPSSGYPVTPMTAPLPSLPLDSVQSPAEGPFRSFSNPRRTSFPNSPRPPRPRTLNEQHQYHSAGPLVQYGMSALHSEIYSAVSNPSSTSDLSLAFQRAELKISGISQEDPRFGQQQNYAHGYASASPPSGSHGHSSASSVAPSFNASPAPLYNTPFNAFEYQAASVPSVSPGSGPPYGVTHVALPSSPLAAGSGGGARHRAWSIGARPVEQEFAGASSASGRPGGGGIRRFRPSMPTRQVQQSGYLFSEVPGSQSNNSPIAPQSFLSGHSPLTTDEITLTSSSAFSISVIDGFATFQTSSDGILPPLNEVQLRSDFKQENHD